MVTEILRRSRNQFVGMLQQADQAWFVLPDGSQMTTPIVVRDVGPGLRNGTKVVAEIVQYGQAGDLHSGVIVEALGQGGQTDVETRAVIRAHGLEEEHGQDVLDQANAAASAFEAGGAPADGRTDLSGQTVITIDPPDARDYDDAISLQSNDDGTCTLGVHIADVSHFVTEGSPLDVAARRAVHQRVLPPQGAADAAGGAVQWGLFPPAGPAAVLQERVHYVRQRRRSRLQ